VSGAIARGHDSSERSHSEVAAHTDDRLKFDSSASARRVRAICVDVERQVFVPLQTTAQTLPSPRALTSRYAHNLTNTTHALPNKNPAKQSISLYITPLNLQLVSIVTPEPRPLSQSSSLALVPRLRRAGVRSVPGPGLQDRGPPIKNIKIA
jgi:hypothetical protein